MCWPGYDGGEADDAATTDGGRPAVAGAGGELHGSSNTHRDIHTQAAFQVSSEKNSCALVISCHVIDLTAVHSSAHCALFKCVHICVAVRCW